MTGRQWCVFLCVVAVLISALAVASTLTGASYEWVTTPLVIMFILGFVIVVT